MAVLVAGIVLSVVLYRYVQRNEQAEAQQEFDQQAATISQRIERDLMYHVQFVDRFKAGGTNSEVVDLSEFNTQYFEILRPIVRRTVASAAGMEAAQMIGYVPGERRDLIESIIPSFGVPGFQISDRGVNGMERAAARPYHVPIYMSDDAFGPLPDTGLDLARDERQVREFQRVGESGGLGAWPASSWEFSDAELRYRLVAPAYLSPTSPTTPEERRATLGMFNSFVIRPGLIFSSALNGYDRDGIELQVYDDQLPADGWPALIYSTLPGEQESTTSSNLRSRTTVPLAERSLRFEFTPGAGYQGMAQWESRSALVAGLVISALIALYLATVARNTARNRQHEAMQRAYLTSMNTALEQEIAERRQAEAALRRSEGQYRAVVEQVKEVIFQSDTGCRWTFLNPAWTEITGFSIEESLGLTPLEFVHEDDRREVKRFVDAVFRGEQDSFRFEVRHMTKAGAVRWLDVYACTVRNEQGVITGLSGTLADITERKNFEAQLAHQAYHDPLTGLPNRAGFTKRLATTLTEAQRSDADVVLMLMDLDGFKLINDTFGHPAGDAVLAETANRLRACVGSEDMVARLGGDEFTIMVTGEIGQREAQAFADKILRALRPPISWHGHELRIGASIGIATSTRAERPDTDELVRRADIALYEAKAAGKGCAVPYRHTPVPVPERLSA